MNRVRALWADDQGLGMVLALSVSFIILALGATWYATSIHELEEVSYDEHRTLAVNLADSGIREAMHRLANESAFRDAAKTSDGATAGISGGQCDLATLQGKISGDVVELGDYWYRATKVNPTDDSDLRYIVQAWGWGGGVDTVQPAVRHTEIQVELIPDGDGFRYALFAAEGGLTAGNRKEIYGDIFSGEDLVLDNFTRVYPNDDGYPGNGAIRVYRDLYISSGSNVEAWGDVRVNGFIEDRKTGSRYLADLVVLHDNPLSTLTDSYFKNGTIDGTLYAAAPASDVTGNINAGLEVYNATGIAPVPPVALPAFTWNASDYTPTGVVHASWADFDAWYGANKSTLSGAHYVQDSGHYTLNMGNVYLTGDFILVFDGSITVRKTPKGADLAPATVVLAGIQTTSEVILGQSANSIENEVHHLIYSAGSFNASQQTTIYGALYGDRDDSTNRLEVHFRPPSNDAISGFTFDPATVNSYLPQPGVWRELPEDIDNYGLVDPSGGYFCALP